MDRVIIFDTTLRDGEQAPGFSMNTGEKLEMARQLARLNVDVIEAGFPISSDEDFEATREVARQVGALEGAPVICGLSRVGLKDLADRKKEIFDDDLISIVKDDIAQVPETYTLDYLHTISGTGIIPSATVRLKKDEDVFPDSGVGDGPVDAVLNAIDAITGLKGRLQDYQLRAVTSGKDALGEVSVKVDFDGNLVFGKGSSTDVIEASARAYVNALNRLVHPAKGRNVHEIGP